MKERIRRLARGSVPLTVATLAAITVLACNREAGSANSDTTAAQSVPAAAASAVNVRGTVASVSATDIAIKSADWSIYLPASIGGHRSDDRE